MVTPMIPYSVSEGEANGPTQPAPGQSNTDQSRPFRLRPDLPIPIPFPRRDLPLVVGRGPSTEREAKTDPHHNEPDRLSPYPANSVHTKPAHSYLPHRSTHTLPAWWGLVREETKMGSRTGRKPPKPVRLQR